MLRPLVDQGGLRGREFWEPGAVVASQTIDAAVRACAQLVDKLVDLEPIVAGLVLPATTRFDDSDS